MAGLSVDREGVSFCPSRVDMKRHIPVGDGVVLRCWDAGRGPPVLLLHGFANTATLNWRIPLFFRWLARRFRVIAVDQRGHGGSSKPRYPETFGLELVRDVRRLLDHLGIDRVHLVGMSLGGFVALKSASEIPDRLRSVTLLGAGWKDETDQGFVAALRNIADVVERGRGIAPLASLFPGKRPAPTWAHKMLVWYLTRMTSDKASLAALIRSLPRLALSAADVAAIETPLCSIIGSHDPFLIEAQALWRLQPHTSFTVIHGAGHLDLVLRGNVRRAVRDFVLQQESPDAR